MATEIDRIKLYHGDPSIVEKTSCGIPNARTLLDTGYGWDRDLHKYRLATNGRLTNDGKKLTRASNRDWVSELPDGSIVPHPDFDLAVSMLDNLTAGAPNQLRVNRLCREIAMCSLATVNKQLWAGSEQAIAKLEDARTNLKTKYTLWSRHLTGIDRNNIGQPIISETWTNQHQAYTQALAQAVGDLSSLVLDRDQFKTRRGEQSSRAPTTSSNHEIDSLTERFVQSNSSEQTGESGDRGLGGLFTPSDQNGFVRNAQYGDDDEEPERGSSKGFKGLLKRMKKA